jgi:hypothetical protein
MDFQERLVDDITYELLEKTCYLTRIPPLNSIENTCPNVSMAEFCRSKIEKNISIDFKMFILDDEMNVKIMPKSKMFDDISPNRSFINHIGDNPHNHGDLSSIGSLGMIILAVYLAMYI